MPARPLNATRHPLQLAGGLIGLSLACAGCIATNSDRLAPETRFRPLSAVTELTGVFRNQGASRSGQWKPLLSDYLFPRARLTAPRAEIRFSVPTASHLRCEAVVDGTVVASRVLVEGRDFRLEDGCVRLADGLDEAGVMEGGIGITTEVSRLGLIDNGDMVLRCDGGGAGLMLFIVPMAVTGRVEAAFERIRTLAPASS